MTCRFDLFLVSFLPKYCISVFSIHLNQSDKGKQSENSKAESKNTSSKSKKSQSEADKGYVSLNQIDRYYNECYERFLENKGKDTHKHAKLYQIEWSGKLKAFIIGAKNVYVVNIGLTDKFPKMPMLLYPQAIISIENNLEGIISDDKNCIKDDLSFKIIKDLSDEGIDESEAISILNVRFAKIIILILCQIWNRAKFSILHLYTENKT